MTNISNRRPPEIWEFLIVPGDHRNGWTDMERPLPYLLHPHCPSHPGVPWERMNRHGSGGAGGEPDIVAGPPVGGAGGSLVLADLVLHGEVEVWVDLVEFGLDRW